MNLMAPPAAGGAIEYPDSDGKRMADNTKQFRWIHVLHGNLVVIYRDREDVFVAGDLLWYPEKGHPEIRTAADVMVVFGRPKGDRGSYKQWEEAGIPATVAFEILSPGNTVAEMADKFAFYEDYGVEEYIIYDPDGNRLQVFVRRGEILARVRQLDGFVSARLGIRFDLSGPEMVVYYPDGRRFLTFEELEAERALAEQRAQNAEQHAQDVQRRAERQAELMRRVLRQQATAEELQELNQLIEQTPPSP
jgi:Uma2 family endonuclease